MITIEAPWEALLNWAEDCKRDSYVFDAIDNQIAGPVSMDEAILVAAAPDLLEALINLADLLITIGYGNTREGQQARAAIKKAKGE